MSASVFTAGKLMRDRFISEDAEQQRSKRNSADEYGLELQGQFAKIAGISICCW